MHIKLWELRIGQRAVLRRILPTDAQVAMMNMGLLPGDVVELTNRAPNNGPVAIWCNGTKIACRSDVAQQIEVELL